MNTLRATLTAAALVCGFPSAKADSDGYFCVGPNYLAYQLNSPGFAGAHKLIVIPFVEGQSAISNYAASLPDFQVHDMICKEKHVRVVGWKSVHDITWDSDDPYPLEVMTGDKAPGPPEHGDNGPPLSLVYGPDQKISLHDSDSRYAYRLEISRKDVPELLCTELVTVKLSKVDFDVLIDSKILVSRDVPTECGKIEFMEGLERQGKLSGVLS